MGREIQAAALVGFSWRSERWTSSRSVNSGKGDSARYLTSQPLDLLLHTDLYLTLQRLDLLYIYYMSNYITSTKPTKKKKKKKS